MPVSAIWCTDTAGRNLKILRPLFESIVARLTLKRKLQFVSLALPHLTEVSYSRLAQNGFRPNGIIDIGAYHGEWSRLIAGVYPQTPILMIEAQAEKKPQLETVCRKLSQAEFEISLLGDKDNFDARFNVMERGSSLYDERSNVPRTTRTLTMHTLDTILSRHPKLKAPLFVKLDVQGAELDVLAGGSRTLSMAEVVQLEVALMNYNEGAPDMKAVIDYMAGRDFLFFDVCGFLRPDPTCLSQIDVLFVRKGSMLRKEYFTF